MTNTHETTNEHNGVETTSKALELSSSTENLKDTNEKLTKAAEEAKAKAIEALKAQEDKETKLKEAEAAREAADKAAEETERKRLAQEAELNKLIEYDHVKQGLYTQLTQLTQGIKAGTVGEKELDTIFNQTLTKAIEAHGAFLGKLIGPAMIESYRAQINIAKWDRQKQNLAEAALAAAALEKAGLDELYAGGNKLYDVVVDTVAEQGTDKALDVVADLVHQDRRAEVVAALQQSIQPEIPETEAPAHALSQELEDTFQETSITVTDPEPVVQTQTPVVETSPEVPQVESTLPEDLANVVIDKGFINPTGNREIPYTSTVKGQYNQIQYIPPDAEDNPHLYKLNTIRGHVERYALEAPVEGIDYSTIASQLDEQIRQAGGNPEEVVSQVHQQIEDEQKDKEKQATVQQFKDSEPLAKRELYKIAGDSMLVEDMVDNLLRQGYSLNEALAQIRNEIQGSTLWYSEPPPPEYADKGTSAVQTPEQTVNEINQYLASHPEPSKASEVPDQPITKESEPIVELKPEQPEVKLETPVEIPDLSQQLTELGDTLIGEDQTIGQVFEKYYRIAEKSTDLNPLRYASDMTASTIRISELENKDQLADQFKQLVEPTVDDPNNLDAARRFHQHLIQPDQSTSPVSEATSVSSPTEKAPELTGKPESKAAGEPLEQTIETPQPEKPAEPTPSSEVTPSRPQLHEAITAAQDALERRQDHLDQNRPLEEVRADEEQIYQQVGHAFTDLHHRARTDEQLRSLVNQAQQAILGDPNLNYQDRIDRINALTGQLQGQLDQTNLALLANILTTAAGVTDHYHLENQHSEQPFTPWNQAHVETPPSKPLPSAKSDNPAERQRARDRAHAEFKEAKQKLDKQRQEERHQLNQANDKEKEAIANKYRSQPNETDEEMAQRKIGYVTERTQLAADWERNHRASRQQNQTETERQHQQIYEKYGLNYRPPTESQPTTPQREGISAEQAAAQLDVSLHELFEIHYNLRDLHNAQADALATSFDISPRYTPQDIQRLQAAKALHDGGTEWGMIKAQLKDKMPITQSEKQKTSKSPEPSKSSQSSTPSEPSPSSGRPEPTPQAGRGAGGGRESGAGRGSRTGGGGNGENGNGNGERHEDGEQTPGRQVAENYVNYRIASEQRQLELQQQIAQLSEAQRNNLLDSHRDRLTQEGLTRENIAAALARVIQTRDAGSFPPDQAAAYAHAEWALRQLLQTAVDQTVTDAMRTPDTWRLPLENTLTLLARPAESLTPAQRADLEIYRATLQSGRAQSLLDRSTERTLVERTIRTQHRGEIVDVGQIEVDRLRELFTLSELEQINRFVGLVQRDYERLFTPDGLVHLDADMQELVETTMLANREPYATQEERMTAFDRLHEREMLLAQQRLSRGESAPTTQAEFAQFYALRSLQREIILAEIGPTNTPELQQQVTERVAREREILNSRLLTRNLSDTERQGIMEELSYWSYVEEHLQLEGAWDDEAADNVATQLRLNRVDTGAELLAGERQAVAKFTIDQAADELQRVTDQINALEANNRPVPDKLLHREKALRERYNHLFGKKETAVRNLEGDKLLHEFYFLEAQPEDSRDNTRLNRILQEIRDRQHRADWQAHSAEWIRRGQLTVLPSGEIFQRIQILQSLGRSLAAAEPKEVLPEELRFELQRLLDEQTARQQLTPDEPAAWNQADIDQWMADHGEQLRQALPTVEAYQQYLRDQRTELDRLRNSTSSTSSSPESRPPAPKTDAERTARATMKEKRHRRDMESYEEAHRELDRLDKLIEEHGDDAVDIDEYEKVEKRLHRLARKITDYEDDDEESWYTDGEFKFHAEAFKDFATSPESAQNEMNRKRELFYKLITELESQDLPFSQQDYITINKVKSIYQNIRVSDSDASRLGLTPEALHEIDSFRKELLGLFENHRRAHDFRWLAERASGIQDLQQAYQIFPVKAAASMFKEVYRIRKPEKALDDHSEDAYDKVKIVDVVLEYQDMLDVHMDLTDRIRTAKSRGQKAEADKLEGLQKRVLEAIKSKAAGKKIEWLAKDKRGAMTKGDLIKKLLEKEEIKDKDGKKIGEDFKHIKVSDNPDEHRGAINRVAAGLGSYFQLDISRGVSMYDGLFFAQRLIHFNDYLLNTVVKKKYKGREALVRHSNWFGKQEAWSLLTATGLGVSQAAYDKIAEDSGLKLESHLLGDEESGDALPVSVISISDDKDENDPTKYKVEKLQESLKGLKDQQASIFIADKLLQVEGVRKEFAGGGDNYFSHATKEKLAKIITMFNWFESDQEDLHQQLRGQFTRGYSEYTDYRPGWVSNKVVWRDIPDKTGKIVRRVPENVRSLAEEAEGRGRGEVNKPAAHRKLFNDLTEKGLITNDVKMLLEYQTFALASYDPDWMPWKISESLFGISPGSTGRYWWLGIDTMVWIKENLNKDLGKKMGKAAAIGAVLAGFGLTVGVGGWILGIFADALSDAAKEQGFTAKK